MSLFEPSLTVVIPAFNEADNLKVVLPDALRFMSERCVNCTLLLIDDGSKDGTASVIAEYVAKHPQRVQVITHPRNLGLTAALRSGFFGAHSELVTWIPADGQIPISELDKMLRAYRGEDLLLTTYRHRPDGLWRATMSKTVRIMVRLATGFADRLEGPYLFRRALIDELNLVCMRSAGSIGLEIAAKSHALGKRIGSTEIECVPRLSGRSKVADLRNIVTYFGEIWLIHRSQSELLASRR
ncbi:MAG TPA: glycosyltransferase family 2 protein [Pseudomonadota bacterium]|nr:glycosyltransferase family 2 protein [Pseudomonadota bacterium]HNI59886.1 glycosyltransferase family 2 protein [Pseudomonadota bacterium]HNN52434.1 glycosyltransferase family 2 protein [Pseudomonadota bacterium]HNO68481.1 glycosyltransferase family 2 protein [Pseudomonadota bacterium]